MRELSPEEEAILETIDAQMKKVAKKLEKVQPLIDQRNRLSKMRAMLLDERSTTGGVRSGVTMESVITVLGKGPAKVKEIAAAVGGEPTAIRAHLNRYKDERYKVNDDKEWSLIGKEKSKA